MPFQFVYPANRKGTLPGSRGQSLADQFHPGEFLVKQKPKQQTPAPQPAAKPQPPKQSLLSKVKSTVADNAKKAVIAVGNPGVDLVHGKGGKAAHDTAHLVENVTGGTANQFAKAAVNVPVALKREVQNKPVEDINKNVFKTTKPKDIAKKIGGSTVGTGSLFLGGGEVKGAKTLLAASKKVIGKKVAKDAAIGAVGNTSATVTTNPNASKKDLAKSAAIGAGLGAAAPFALKGAAKGVQKLDAHTEQALSNIMDQVRAPRSLLEKAKTQSLLDAARQKETAKAAIEAPKLEQKIELINAKKADGKFTNVDKVKVKQLEDQKKALGIPTAETPNTKPVTTPTKVSDEQFAHDYIANNRSQAEANYAKRTKEEFGVTKNNVVSGDEAKFIIPGFEANKSVPYHNAASQFAKDHYKKLLADESTKDQPVLITAGGSGAGKT
jgi:hypothetical protein